MSSRRVSILEINQYPNQTRLDTFEPQVKIILTYYIRSNPTSLFVFLRLFRLSPLPYVLPSIFLVWLVFSIAGQLYLFFPTDFYYPKPPSLHAENASDPSPPSLVHTPKRFHPRQQQPLVLRDSQEEKLEKQPSFSIDHYLRISYTQGRLKACDRREVHGKSAEPLTVAFLDQSSRRRAL